MKKKIIIQNVIEQKNLGDWLRVRDDIWNFDSLEQQCLKDRRGKNNLYSYIHSDA